jgi:hypothetical protein
MDTDTGGGSVLVSYGAKSLNDSHKIKTYLYMRTGTVPTYLHKTKGFNHYEGNDLGTSVRDPGIFGADQDPRIRTSV